MSLDWVNIFLQGAALMIIIIGIAGHVLPIIPGSIVTLAGMLILAIVTDAHLSYFDISIILGIALLIGIVDILTSVLCARMAGGSNNSVLLGTGTAVLGGVIKGLPGMVIGAVIGTLGLELKEGSSLIQAVKVTAANLIGFLLGSAVKIILAFIKVIWFLTEVY